MRTELLNHELALTKDFLQTTVEQLERSNEDLTSSNEELQNRMQDLSAANDDLHNILLGIDRPVIIVGLDLRIRRYTQAAERILNLLPADIGRSIAHLSGFIGGFSVERVVSEAIENVVTIERELQAADQHWYRMRIVPYRTLDLAIRGAVITLIDIELPRRRVELLSDIEAYAAHTLKDVQNPLLIVDADQTVLWANPPCYQVFSITQHQTLGSAFARVGAGQWANVELDRLLRRTLMTGAPFQGATVERTTPKGAPRTMVIAGSRIRNVGKDAPLMLISIELAGPKSEESQ